VLLTDEEKRMLAGERGPGIKRAMDFLVKLGASFDAEKLVPISYGHVSYDSCPEDFWNLITDGLSKTPHRVTTHPSYQPKVWKEWGLPLAHQWIDEHERKVKRLKQLGWLRTETCAEYLIGIIPRKGDVVPMAGSCMQVANNSLFGARVDRMGILVSMAAAVCGRTPLMGLLVAENRYASHVVELDDLDVADWTLSDYHCLGYCIGDQIPGFKPVAVNGLPADLTFDLARALVISMPTAGAVTLAHIVGTTPEAPTPEAALGGKKPENVIRVGKHEMKKNWERLNFWDDNVVEHVAFGCPHATIDELARRQGYAGIIERAGGHIICVCPSIRNPFTRRDIAGEKQAKSAATNSARAAHYLATVSGVKVFFGTEEQCINAAITGRWKGDIPQWK